MTVNGVMMFPNANSSLMEQVIFFHDHSMSIMMMIVIIVFSMMLILLGGFLVNKYLFEGQELETMWTIIPAILLIMIIFPSLQILYSMEEDDFLLTIKVSGHQWYWSYEYMDFEEILFDSFMEQEGVNEEFRLLDTDFHVVVPCMVTSRFLVTSWDVIHSWTVPSLGMKVDAVPGRINQVVVLPLRCGLYYGECSEICGVNHSFSPIVMEIVFLRGFVDWLSN